MRSSKAFLLAYRVGWCQSICLNPHRIPRAFLTQINFNFSHRFFADRFGLNP